MNVIIDERKHPQEASTDKKIQITLRLLNAINVKALQQSPPQGGLLYVEANMNRRPTRALIDTGQPTILCRVMLPSNWASN